MRCHLSCLLRDYFNPRTLPYNLQHSSIDILIMSQGSITMIISSATVGPNKSSKIASWLGKRWQQASSVFSTGGQHTSHTSHPHIQINSLPPRQQINSLLLNTLPLEIQRQIYYYVVSSYGNTQHILLSDDHHGQLTHMRCVLPTSHSYFQDHLVRITGVCIPDGAHNNEYRKSAQNGWEILPLLLSCRKMYVSVLFSVLQDKRRVLY